MLKAVRRPGRAVIETRSLPEGIVLRSEYALTRVVAMSKNILRVTTTRREAFSDSPSPFVERRIPTPAAVRVEKGEALIDAGGIRASVSLADGRVRFFNADGLAILSEGEGKSLDFFESTRIARGVPAQTEEIETADGIKTVVRSAPREPYKTLCRARLPLSLTEDEALFGCGQPESGPANLRGRKLFMCQSNRAIALPFIVSTRGWGLLLDCGCPFIFQDGKDGAYLYIEAVEELDYYVIAGSCEEAVKGYHFLTGRPSLLPRWAFGYIQSQERYETQDEVLSIARACRDRGIGVDCVVMDWCSWPDGQWGQKSFDPVRFPAPDAMTRALRDLHAHFMISIWPNVNPNTPNHAEFAAKGQLLPGGSLYDALNPAARETYWKQACEGLYRYGVDGWWCDSSEPVTSEWSRAERPEEDDVYRETRDATANMLGADMGNSYAFFHARTMYEGQRAQNDGKRVVNLTRSGWTGQQKYGVILWSGDITARWETLRKQVAIGLDMCASGIPFWTQDIGGFFVKKGAAWYWDGLFEDGWADPEFQELFVRWYEYAAFLPVFRGHGTDVRRELWNATGENYDALLRFNRVRYELLPYIYSLAGRIALEGGLMMKPLAFNYPDDAGAREIDDEFLLGDDLLVCPVTEYRARRRRVYLPAGIWHERVTGCVHQGGGWIDADAPLNAIPVFVRAGAIVPVFRPALSTEEAFAQACELCVFPGADGAFTLYEDAGDGYGYENGGYTLTSLRWNDSAGKLTCSNEALEYTVRIMK
ncbi:MAG: DUF5110 domain-containing protein [Clostridia bacterium]|nr:DUF5110 domain-containing protein [Clostridia bacterium]